MSSVQRRAGHRTGWVLHVPCMGSKPGDVNVRIAQMAEHQTHNLKVAGSSPVPTSPAFRVQS